MSSVVEAEELFLQIQIHTELPNEHRRADLDGRLLIVSSAVETSEFLRRYLQRFIAKEKARYQSPTSRR
jgi:hypothetical protein